MQKSLFGLKISSNLKCKELDKGPECFGSKQCTLCKYIFGVKLGMFCHFVVYGLS